MTLILGALAQAVAHQVGDRLVSTARGSQINPHDSLANKHVIVVTEDALVSVGYTGLAYLGGQPTDEAIAEAAIGRPVGRGITVAGGRIGPIHRIADRIAERLDHAVSDLGDYGVEAMVVGLKRGKRKRNRVEPLLWRITKVPRSLVAIHRTEEVPFRWHTRFSVQAIGDTDSSLVDAMVHRIRAIEEQGTSRRDAITEALVDTVRSHARSKATVGADCMVVRLWPQAGKYIVEVDYQPMDRHSVSIERVAGAPFSFPEAYSPWFISEGFVASPAIVKGGGWDLGHVEFRIRVPSDPGRRDPRAFFGSQPRKPPPK